MRDCHNFVLYQLLKIRTPIYSLSEFKVAIFQLPNGYIGILTGAKTTKIFLNLNLISTCVLLFSQIS